MHTRATVYITPFQRSYFTSLKSYHIGYRDRELPTLWTQSVAVSAWAPVDSCLAAAVVTCILSHSASAICLVWLKSFS